MNALNRLLSTGALVAILAILAGENAVALGPYAPSADTYVDINRETASHGDDQNLLLSASNLAGCVETTHLWLKFDIPSSGTTIAEASLTLAFGPGAGSVDLELRTSADTSWSEDGLTWGNQPTLNDDVLAMAAGVRPGSTAIFSSGALAAYVNAHRGLTVPLVVRADCDGSVSTSVALALRSRENPSGPAASLTLTPTRVICPDFVEPLDVGMEDVQDIASRWRAPDRYDIRYDVAPNTLDGVINILDIMTVMTHWGESCPSGAICPDFDEPSGVGIEDIQAVASRWRLSATNRDPDDDPSTPNYETRFDLDRDGVITIADVMDVAMRWGDTCS